MRKQHPIDRLREDVKVMAGILEEIENCGGATSYDIDELLSRLDLTYAKKHLHTLSHDLRILERQA